MNQFIPLLAATLTGTIVAIGWFITGKLNRANNIALKRLDYRIKALESFLPVWNEIEKDGAALVRTDVIEKLANARQSFHLYGAQNDIDLIEALVTAIERRDLDAANRALPAVVSLVRQGVRLELRADA